MKNVATVRSGFVRVGNRNRRVIVEVVSEDSSLSRSDVKLSVRARGDLSEEGLI